MKKWKVIRFVALLAVAAGIAALNWGDLTKQDLILIAGMGALAFFDRPGATA